MADTQTHRLPESSRVEAFSDGVFAVAITLLVLELHAPEGRGEFLSELGNQWQSYVAYLAAFIIIGVIWLTHHSLFTRIKFVDTRLMAHNLLHLLTTSLLPFAAAVVSSSTRVGDKHDETIAVLFFAFISTLTSLSWYVLTSYVQRAPHLLVDPEDATALRAERRMQPIAMIPAFVAAAVSFISPTVGLIIMGVTPLYYLVSIRRAERAVLA